MGCAKESLSTDIAHLTLKSVGDPLGPEHSRRYNRLGYMVRIAKALWGFQFLAARG